MTDNHVSLLVLSLFNVSISSDEMHKFYAYDYTLKTWSAHYFHYKDCIYVFLFVLRSSSSRELNEDDEVLFKIASFQHSNGVINIEGVLLEV